MWKRRQEAFLGRPFLKGYLPTIQESLRSRPVSERHPVARPRVNTQIAQGNGPWLELGDLGREVGVCRGKGYTFVAVHCIKDPGLWGWSLGSSQSCHFKMGLCLPAKRQKKKKNKRSAGQNSQTTHSFPHIKAQPSFQKQPVNQRASPMPTHMDPDPLAYSCQPRPPEAPYSKSSIAAP